MAVKNDGSVSAPVKVIDNITQKLCDDLSGTISDGGRVSVAAACFSIYAYRILKEELESVKEFRFIFTSPTFTTEKAEKEKREFYIPRLNRERGLYGTEFEVRLRNELTQKAIARECAEWIRGRARFKSNVTNENMNGFMNVEGEAGAFTYMPVNGFTTADLGCERGNNSYNMVTRLGSQDATREFLGIFDSLWNDKTRLQDVTAEVIDNISTAYNENSPEFIYFVTLYNIFNEFLEDISEDVLPNEATGFKNSKIWNKLYAFQKDAALAIINKLEKFNGCILADSVGLGKTFTALAVIKYYENRNKTVLVLCPKKLSDNWNTYKGNYLNNPIAADRLRYDVLYHTDLSRRGGYSNGIDLARLNWANYDLVVIDESHNFRNGGDETADEDGNPNENRYLRLMNRVIKEGVKTKVLMLSATPVNNKFADLKNQLALAYEGNSRQLSEKLKTKRSLEEIFRGAQAAFKRWSKQEAETCTTASLLDSLDFDFFELLDSVTIARSRKHIEKYYNIEEVGRFPERLKPISRRPALTDLKGAITYNEIYEKLSALSLMVYMPSFFIHESRKSAYETADDGEELGNLTMAGREAGIRRLMRINLLKRLESSVNSFELTLSRISALISETIARIDKFAAGETSSVEVAEVGDARNFDEDEQNMDIFAVSRKMAIKLGDMDYLSWRSELVNDLEILDSLIAMTRDITPEHDTKLQTLLEVIADKIEHPINGANKKVLVFTAFADTASYLYDNVSKFAKKNYGLDTAMITGSVDGRTTVPKLKADFNTVLTCFSPLSKEKELLMPNNRAEIDILIATDCISEGQNLQDCDYLINYDIHWNPVRIIQRFGRIDRIGSKNSVIQLVNFWPDMTLDDYINLKDRVELRMKASILTATGDENPLLSSEQEQGGLEYRKQQLKRLQEEVVDIEDMSDGISIMDLGLNEFRLDLLEYAKTNPDVDKAPFGLHAVAAASGDAGPGVVFVLKNLSDGVNIDRQNRLHPFYMVYIASDKTVVCNHLSPKEMLDRMRLLCKGRHEPEMALCRQFNKETKDGRDMKRVSQLLEAAVASIITTKDERAADSFFKSGAQAFLDDRITGLDNFELICFLVIRRQNNKGVS